MKRGNDDIQILLSGENSILRETISHRHPAFSPAAHPLWLIGPSTSSRIYMKSLMAVERCLQFEGGTRKSFWIVYGKSSNNSIKLAIHRGNFNSRAKKMQASETKSYADNFLSKFRAC